jgi:hypothetical protein
MLAGTIVAEGLTKVWTPTTSRGSNLDGPDSGVRPPGCSMEAESTMRPEHQALFPQAGLKRDLRSTAEESGIPVREGISS